MSSFTSVFPAVIYVTRYTEERSVTRNDLAFHEIKILSPAEILALLKLDFQPAGYTIGLYATGVNGYPNGILLGPSSDLARPDEVRRERLCPRKTDFPHDVMLMRGHDWLNDPCPREVYIVESFIKGIVVHRETSLPVIALNGIWGWSKARYWETCQWRGVKVRILFDSLNRVSEEKRTNQIRAEQGLARMLTVDFGCEVEIVRLPEPPLSWADEDWGVDDYSAYRIKKSLPRDLTALKADKHVLPTTSNQLVGYTVGEIRQRERKPHLLRTVLPQKGVALTYADSKVGKTTYTIGLAAAIALRETYYFGIPIMRYGRVVLINMEGQELKDQMDAYAIHHKLSSEQLEQFHHNIVVLEESSINGPLNFTDPATHERISEFVKACHEEDSPVVMVVLDTVNRALKGADENSSEGMGHIVSAADYIKSQCGVLVDLIHHEGKDPSRGGRGHSSLEAAVDAVVNITVNDAGVRSVVLMRSRISHAPQKLHDFNLHVVTVGKDDYGDITGCTVAPLAEAVVSQEAAMVSDGKVGPDTIWGWIYLWWSGREWKSKPVVAEDMRTHSARIIPSKYKGRGKIRCTRDELKSVFTGFAAVQNLLEPVIGGERKNSFTLKSYVSKLG